MARVSRWWTRRPYFHTRDARRIACLSGALEAGLVGINEGAVSSEAAPFGGIKASGFGREGSRYGLDEYMHVNYLCQGGLDGGSSPARSAGLRGRVDSGG